MSARKLENPSVTPSVSVRVPASSISLSTNAILIRKNGIEFHAPAAIAPWTEMTVELLPPHEKRKLQCTGVVVACNGNRHSGYHVSMIFTNVSRQSQAQLNRIALA